MLHDEVASFTLEASEKRSLKETLREIIEKDTMLSGANLVYITNICKEFSVVFGNNMC